MKRTSCRLIAAAFESPRADGSPWGFEERWLNACGAQGRVGSCPSLNPYFRFDVMREQPEINDSLCMSFEPRVAEQMHRALASMRDALRRNTEARSMGRGPVA